MSGFEIVEKSDDVLPALEALYPRAFPDEDLLPLLRELYLENADLVSPEAIENKGIIGHALFTPCTVSGNPGKVALLGPVAVYPANQGNGVGSALIRKGFEILESAGYSGAVVLGDPAYYRRLGFIPEKRITTPYQLPEEWQDAWQSVILGDADAPKQGMLEVPRPWSDKTLWLP